MPPTPQISRADVARSLENPASFAEILTREPLWPAQREVALSPARYRVLCAGRQAGKSRLLAVLALHKAFTSPGSRTLIVSAGEDASKRVLAEVAALTSSPLLAGSVLDDNKSTLTLSTGSVVMSVPASPKQVRGWAIDLLIGDECGFWPQELWQAAEPVIIARPGSRVVLCSTPWGGSEHFFRRLWQRGMDRPDIQVEAWHWPSSISPLVDKSLLAEIESRETPDYFRREYLAEWADSAGVYFTERELMEAVADYPLLDPAHWRARTHGKFAAAAGLDWGFSRDAHAMVLVAPVDDQELNGRDVLFIPWLEKHHEMEYSDFEDRVCEVNGAYWLYVVASECNGVGAAPTQNLQRKFMRMARGGAVVPVWTDARRKMSGFSAVKGKLQRGDLILPRVPELLSELRGLTFETMPSGMLRIAAPGTRHDDLAMALMQAVSCVPGREPWQRSAFAPDFPHVVTARGSFFPLDPQPRMGDTACFIRPEGGEKNTESLW